MWCALWWLPNYLEKNKEKKTIDNRNNVLWNSDPPGTIEERAKKDVKTHILQRVKSIFFLFIIILKKKGTHKNMGYIISSET